MAIFLGDVGGHGVFAQGRLTETRAMQGRRLHTMHNSARRLTIDMVPMHCMTVCSVMTSVAYMGYAL